MGGRPHHLRTLAVLSTAGLAFSLQQTMVLPALPSLQRDLHTSTAWSTWLVTAFLLTVCISTPILGKLGDQFGKERMLAVSLAIFLVGSIGATCAWDIASLIAFRAIQGAAGAIFPLSFSIIRDEFPEDRVNMGIGWISSIFGVGGLGIVLSGVLIDRVSWRFVFAIGAVVIATSLVLVRLYVPPSPVRKETRVDLPGAALLSAGLVALLLALSEGHAWGWSSGRIAGLFAASAALLVVWVVVELRVPEPMVEMAMFTRRPVLVANAAGFVTGFAMFGSIVLIPHLAQAPAEAPARLAHLVDYGYGLSALGVGLMMLPGVLVQLPSAPLAGWIASRIGPRWPLGAGLLLVTVSTAMAALWNAHAWQMTLCLVVMSVGIAFSFAAMPIMIADAVEQTDTGIALGMNNVVRNVGGVLGGQAAAAILLSDTIAGTSLASLHGYVVAFWAASLVSAVGVGLVCLARPSARRAAVAVAD